MEIYDALKAMYDKIQEITVEKPELESDDYDAGRRDMKNEILNLFNV